MYRIALPCAASCRTRASNRRVSNRPKAAVGSSRISTLDSSAIALAISTSCCSATDRLPTTASGWTCTPSCCSNSAVCRRMAAQEDVLGNGEGGYKRQFLVNRCHAVFARGEGVRQDDRATVQQHLARI